MKKWSIFLKENWIIVLGMLILYLVDVLIIIQTKGMTTPRDEIGMFAVASKLAGLNWSNVIQDSGYYGFGFFGLFFPIFKNINDGDLVHKIILLACCFVKVCVVPIIYNIEIAFLNIKDRKFAGLVALTLSVINVSLRAGRPYNEFPMHLLLWIDTWLLCKLITVYGEQRKKNKYSLLLVLALIYGLLLHVRFVTVIYAFILLFLFLFILTRKCYININLVIVGIIFWGGTNKLIEYAQNVVWGGGSDLGNTTVSISNMIQFSNPKMYLLWSDILIGNFSMMTIQTGGLFIIAFISVIFMIKFFLVERKIEDSELIMLSIAFYSLLCMGATILALMVSGWYGGMTETFFQGETGNKVYSYKGMVYLRYWGIYITPFVLSGLAWINKKKLWISISRATIIGLFLTIILFISMVLPWIENNSHCLTFTQALSLWKKGDECSRETYFVSCMLLMIIISVILWCINTKKTKVLLTLYIIFFSWQQIWSSVYFDIPTTNEIYELVDASVEKLSYDVEESFPKRIVALEFDENRDASYKQSLSLQYYFKNKTIYTTIPERIEYGDLIITREEIPENILIEIFKDKLYECEQIDEDEFWYFINED